MTKNSAEALKHLKRLRHLIAKAPGPIFKMTKEQAIRKLRETREAIWEEKFAHAHRA